MTLEDKFKKQLGDLSFAVTVLQHQLEETTTELNALKEKNKDVGHTKKS